MAQTQRGRRLMGEINVVPYIDVMLVLLIIFMVTAPLLQQGIKVELPKASAEPLPPDLHKHEPLILNVDKKGNFYLNLGNDQKSPIDEQTLVDRVGAVLRRDPETTVLVAADTGVPYGRVVTGMVLLQNAGAQKIGFQTDPSNLPVRRPRP